MAPTDGVACPQLRVAKDMRLTKIDALWFLSNKRFD
jgi:hypothetical protein